MNIRQGASLLHAQQVMPPNDYICDDLLVRTLVLKGNSLYLLDDPRTKDSITEKRFAINVTMKYLYSFVINVTTYHAFQSMGMVYLNIIS